MEKIKLKQRVVRLALDLLAQNANQLDSDGAMEQQVYVSYRFSPESFPDGISEGGLLLRFLRDNEFSEWHLDDSCFTIIEDFGFLESPA